MVVWNEEGQAVFVFERQSRGWKYLDSRCLAEAFVTGTGKKPALIGINAFKW
jgi:hypothetical protein